jgi:3-hydroxy acid dehydrogenase/malonic semialdehyde reductase
MASLRDRIAFVTGASSGIGEACARTFARDGAKLILNARRKDRLQALSSELKAHYGVSSLTCPFDVRNLSEVRTALETLPTEWASVDVLINNAGLARGFDKLQEGRLEDWEEMIDSNIKGLLFTTRFILPGMLNRGRGHIVNIASLAGIQTYPRGNVYCATKAAVRVISDGLKQDLLGTPIRVTAISPGLVETEFAKVRFHGDVDRAAQTYRGLAPLTADDVADAVHFCVTRPPHVNISEIVLMPTDQSSSVLVNRREKS